MSLFLCFHLSFDEMGYYDLPAEIDYVLQQTKHTQLYYMGHSMGKHIEE